MIKKFLQKIFKIISYNIFIKIYGEINEAIDCDDSDKVDVYNLKKENNFKYNIYKISDARLYTDRVHDTAILVDNKIINGPSFQQRFTKDLKIYNSKVLDNIVLAKGTPRKLKIMNSTILSLLTGGGGNNNYWHWLFDVLPRFHLCNKFKNIKDIDYFLLPSLRKKFQNETLDLLNIPDHKRLSSEVYRHIKTKFLYVTDHPYVINNNSTEDIQNIPYWIILWLKESFLKGVKKDEAQNIFIERNDKVSDLPSQRMLSNEDEVKKYLLENNFISVKLHELKFIEQVKLFYNAKFIVGLHGSGFANTAFCEEGTNVIEFRSNNAGPVIENLSKKNNLNYQSIISESDPIYNFKSPTQQGKIEISINQLNKIIKGK